MGHSSSVKKSARSSLRKTIVNKPIRTQSKSCVIKADRIIQSGDMDAAEKAVREAVSILDKTAKNKVIHPNAAARRKSRLVKRLKAAKANTDSAKKE